VAIGDEHRQQRLVRHGGEGEGSGESNVSHSMARAPKRRRSCAEASRGGSIAGDG